MLQKVGFFKFNIWRNSGTKSSSFQLPNTENSPIGITLHLPDMDFTCPPTPPPFFLEKENVLNKRKEIQNLKIMAFTLPEFIFIFALLYPNL